MTQAGEKQKGFVMAKTYKGSPLFHMRMPEGLYDWLRDYSKRIGKPTSVIIKDHLQKLQRKDLSQLKKDERLDD